jgi:iron complex outermembrane receptor protein
MLSAGFRHRSTLLEVDRDFADRPFLENDNGFAWSTSGSPGAYVFLRSSGTRITPSILTGGGYAGDRQMSISGIVRDPNCTDVGGYAGWSSTPSPVCYYHIVNNEKLAEDEDTYQAYGEVNYRFGESLKFHGEGLYYGLRLPDIAAHPGDAFLNVPIDASSSTGAQQNIGGTAAYFVAGANPAVADMLGKLTNSDGVTTAYTTGQISDIIAGGRAGLVLGTWRPFGFGGNPLTGKAYDNQTNQTDQFRFTGEFSGDLPEIFGSKLHWSTALTYNRTIYSVATHDILVDRLQQALNGLGGEGCDTDPSTPGTVEGGVAGVGACRYFNPFSSAIEKNIVTGQTNPGFVGSGTYPGYMPGKGLQNDPDLIRWLYVPIELDRDYDMFVADLKFDGDTPIELPGGPIAVAFGGQYRYVKEQFALDNYSNRAINPCATIGETVCTNRTGPLMGSRAATVLGTTLESQREFPVWSAFGQINLPLFDTLNIDLSTRYEKFISDLTDVDNSVVVGAGGVKWDVTPNFALRGFAGSTFSQVNPPRDDGPTQNNSIANISSFGVGGSGNAIFLSNYDNTAVKPETGFNYNVGAIFHAGNFKANIDYYNIKIGDYTRTLTTTNVLAALVQPGQIAGPTNLINCSSPLLTNSVPELGNQPFVVLNGPCVQGSSMLNSDPSATPGIGGFGGGGGAINYFGGTNEVNAGELKTTGIDVSASYDFDDLFGGRLTASVDVTKVLTYDFSDFDVAGISVAPGFEGVGSMNEAPGKNGQHISEYRANVGLNFAVGRHNFNWTTRWMSELEQDNVALFAEQNSRNANIGGAGGVVTCPSPDPNITSNLGMIPSGAGAGLYGALASGTVGFCSGYNTSILSGQGGIPATFNSDFSYRLQLPWETVFTATIQNVFDEDPQFSRAPQSYDAYTGSPLGRTIRVGLRKKF